MTPLRPMSTGEILDRTFSMYRGNFWLFVGISAIPPALMLLVNLAVTGTTFANVAARTGAPVQIAAIAIGAVGAFIGVIAYLAGLAVAQGATVYAVSAVHLGQTIGIRESYQRMRGKFGRVINVIFSVFVRVFGAGFLLTLIAILLSVLPSTFIVARGGFNGPVAVILMSVLMIVFIAGAVVLTITLFVRYSLAVPSCVLENLKARAALKRSAFLAKGSRGKILAIYLLVLLLSWAVSFAVLLPIQLLTLAATLKARVAVQIVLAILNHVASFTVGALVGPLATIALALVYYDERVRKEAFDIQFMMESLGGNPPVPPPPAEPQASPQIG